jgi:hypothetical protein
MLDHFSLVLIGIFGYTWYSQKSLGGFGDPFGMGDSLEPYTIGPDVFNDDWQLVEATDDERRRLRAAGFRIE